MKRKIISILMFCCVMLLSACKVSQTGELHQEVNAQSGSNVERPPSATNSDTLGLPKPTEMTEHMINEQKAMEQYNRLFRNFARETGKEGVRIYTDYCCGVYLNEEGNLVVCVTRDYDLSSGLIEKYTENEDIIIQVADYPYYALEEEMKIISNQYKRLKEAFAAGTENEVCGDMDVERVRDLLESTSGFGLSEMTNRIVVGIRDLDDEKIETFQSVISDKGMVDFEVGFWVSYD